MPITSVADLVEVLRGSRLLSPAQLEELAHTLQPRFSDPKALTRELVRRGWLTAFQAQQLWKGQGPRLLLGPYVLLEQLGEGGMGQVFKARHVRLERVVALKVIGKQFLDHPQAVERFQREARAAARLAHPNIVTLYDADEADGTHFLALEYVEGTDLTRLVEENGPLSVASACDYIRQAALGLQHAHERGLVHRDIKPANLLVTGTSAGTLPQVKILDMGLSRIVEKEARTDALTKLGAVIGTPDYLSPEQAVDAHRVDIRADIYSLGCTFYHLLAGRPPFPGGSLTQKLIWHQMAEPPAIEDVRPDLPPGLPAVLRRMMAKRPQDRFQTPAEVAARLGPFAVDTLLSAPVPPQQVQTLVPDIRPDRRVFDAADRRAPAGTSTGRAPTEVPIPLSEAGPRYAPSPRRRPRPTDSARWPLWPWFVLGGGVLALVLVVILIESGRGPAEESRDSAASDKAAPRKPIRPARDEDKSGRSKDNHPVDDKKPDDKPKDDKKAADKPATDKGTADKGKNDGGNKDKGTEGGKKKESNKDKGEKSQGETQLPFAEIWQSANYVPPGPREPSSILVRHGKDEAEWHRLDHKNLTVGVDDTLVSLPGYRSNVGFDNGVMLTLWGDLPEVSLVSPLQESVVIVNDPAKCDLDLTLDHGRIVLANQRATRARVRIHFADPAGATYADQASWVITLKGEGATVGLELWSRYPPEIPFSLDKKKRLGPQTVFYLFVLKGEALVETHEDQEYAMKAPLRRADASPKPANLVWTSDNRGHVEGPLEASRLPDWFLHAYPPFPDWLSKPERESLEKLRLLVIKELDRLSASLSGKKKVEGGLLEELTKKNPVRRALAIRCFGAIGDLPYLLDGLVDEIYPEVRQAAIESLRHWTGLKKENDLILYDTLKKKKGYSDGEARSIMNLLHSFSEKQRELPETYSMLIDYLSHNKGAIKVLAHWHLVRLVPWGRKIAFDPLGESDQVEAAAEAWRKLVPKGTIPKPPKQKKD